MALGSDGNNIGHSKPTTASVRPIDRLDDAMENAVDMLDKESGPKQISGGSGGAGVPFNERWNKKVPPGDPAVQIPINGG